MSGHYFGLDIFDLEEAIIKNRKKILLKRPLKETHRAGIHNYMKKYAKDVFEECDLCKKWIKAGKESFDPDGHSVWSSLMGAPDHSNRWVCSDCWDVIDVAYYGPYVRSRPKNKPIPEFKTDER